MAEFNIDKQSAQNIYQGETLHVHPEAASTASTRLDDLLARIDEQGAAEGEWVALRAEVEEARRSLPEWEATAGALERARRIATGLRATSIAGIIATIISSFAG